MCTSCRCGAAGAPASQEGCGAGIREAFDLVHADAPERLLIANPDGLRLPRGSSGETNWHQQGIQRTGQGQFVVSGSAPEAGYLYFTDAALRVVNVVAPRGTTQAANHRQLNHLGGLQVAGDLLAVGYERYQNGAAGTSRILFYDIADIRRPIALEHLTIVRDHAGQTGGAVGLIALPDCWLVMVANWDAVRVDFYLSHARDLHGRATRFDAEPRWSWSRASHGLADGSVDDVWGWYQNVNLFSEPGRPANPQDLWFVGLYEHRADLYHLVVGRGEPQVRKVGSRTFEGELGFSQAAGVYYDPLSHAMQVYAAEAHLHDGRESRAERWA
jgi:hypothetical protein